MEEDHQGPLSEWRTVSLVTCLRQSLLDLVSGAEGSAGPHVASSARLLEIVDELTARGIDGDSLVRYGLIHEMMLRRVFALILDDLFPIHNVATPGSQTWRSIFQLDHPTVVKKIENFPHDLEGVYTSISGLLTGDSGPATMAFGSVLNWTMDADLGDLLQSSPPTREEVEKASLILPDSETIAAYRWIIDRFSSTYYAEWATDSLHAEWKWQNGLGAAPCPVELTVEPTLNLNALDYQIAYRAVLDSPEASPIVAPPLASQVTPHARALLLDGNAAQAAALFGFASKQDPDNPDLRNNLGFCLIPTAPRVALGHLEAARRLGYSPITINIYNKMCCYVGMNRPGLALKEAEKYFSELQGEEPVSALVWAISESRNYRIVSTNDVHGEMRALAAYAQLLHERRFPDGPAAHPSPE